MNTTRLLLALAAVACAAPALAAQTIQGRFVDPQGEPVPGGRAVLRDRQGHDVATAMTDGRGAFVLQAPRAGRYSLSVERIGYGLSQAPAFELGAGQTVEKQVAANPRQVALQGVVVRGRSRCTPRPGSGPETATVWEEARKALRSARENESAANQYGVRRFWRQLDPEGHTIVRDSVAPAEITTGSPFISAPAERLAETGFIESAGSDLLFHAPDAAVLLSPDFQNGHCFALQEGENGLIGLSFEPVKVGEKSDVLGTLWLDRASAELRRVEYRYTRVPGLREPSDAASGRMDFRRLGDGRFIVSRWAIRMPVIVAQAVASVNRIPGVERSTRDQSQLHYQLAAQLEQGGDVLAVTTASGERVDLAGSATVRGVVFDSTQLQPLAGARVSVGGDGHSAVTDSGGRYTVLDVPPGDYTLAFSSPRLDSLHFVPGGVPVSLHEGQAAELNLWVPPLAAVWAAACADSGRAAGKGVLVGRVHGAAGDPQPGARVAVSWTQPGTPAGTAALVTDAQGVYRLCTAPAGPPLTVRVNAPQATLTVANLRVTEGHALRQDVGLPAAAEAPRPGSAAAAQTTLAGVVRGGSGQPLAGATVRFAELTPVTTDGQGRFRMRALPPRDYLVTVTHPELGTRTVRVALSADAGEVELRPGSGESGALVASVQRVVRLAALQAQARSTRLDIQGFYDRQRSGMGLYITEERLGRNPAGRLTDVLRSVPGIRLVRWVPRDTLNASQRNLGRSGADIDEQYRVASARGSTAVINGQGPCWMDVYLDGVQVQNWNPSMSENLDSFPLSHVQAVEVYRGPAVPPGLVGVRGGAALDEGIAPPRGSAQREDRRAVRTGDPRRSRAGHDGRAPLAASSRESCGRRSPRSPGPCFEGSLTTGGGQRDGRFVAHGPPAVTPCPLRAYISFRRRPSSAQPMPKVSSLFLFVFLTCAPALAAQTVQGAFADPSSGVPIAGARAVLRDAGGREVATASTDVSGSFVIRAPAAGTYVLRIERIGYGLTESAPFALAAGETVQRSIAANPRRIVLEGIVAQSRSRCTPRPGSGPETATVWGEARKVLGSARESGENGGYRYTVRRFTRQLDTLAQTILRDSAATAPVTSGTPFLATSLERLARRGYVESVGRELVFHAPDARVLLSEQFQERHCFSLVDGENGLIGLAFEPVSAEKPDVRGTLWLDRATAELRRMEYAYTQVPGLGPEGNVARGWMEFSRLADGRWIVGRWTIRMPVVEAIRVQSVNRRELVIKTTLTPHLAGIREEGGEVLTAAREGEAPVAIAVGGGSVVGTVTDSTTLRPLAGARVRAAGHEAVADSLGRFSIADLAAGGYELSFTAPRLDSLGFTPAPVRVTVRAGATTEQSLAIPPAEVVWAAACRDLAPGTGVLVGTVRGSAGEPVDDARVTVAWGGARPGSTGTVAGSGGVYRVCGAPAGVPLTLRVATLSAGVSLSGLQVAAGRPRRADVALPPRRTAPTAAAASNAAFGGITGVARDAQGVALPAASVRVDDRPAVVTDARGRFRAGRVAAGAHRITLGHPAVGSRTVDVPLPAEAVEVELRAGAEAGTMAAGVQRVVQLAAIGARARPRSAGLGLQGFYDRQKTGLGVFITGDQLRGNAAGQLSSVLRMVPGVRVVRQGQADTRMLGKGQASEASFAFGSRGVTGIGEVGACWMDVYLDGVLVAGRMLGPGGSMSLDEISVAQVDGVEVYRGASEIPPLYRNSTSSCGVILMWTRRG
jgi:hypothetical protein